MPRLSQLSMSFEPDAAQPMLPLPKLTMLEVLDLDGVSSCPSLTCLSRLTRLSLTGGILSEPPVYAASADILQSIKVCDACSNVFSCPHMALYDHFLFTCLKDLPRLRPLFLRWGCLTC